MTGDTNRKGLVTLGPKLVLAIASPVRPLRGQHPAGERSCTVIPWAFPELGVDREMSLLDQQGRCRAQGRRPLCVGRKGAPRCRGWVALDAVLGHLLAPTSGLMDTTSCSS